MVRSSHPAVPRRGLRLEHPLVSSRGIVKRDYPIRGLSRLPAGSIFHPAVQLQIFGFVHRPSGVTARLRRIERVFSDGDRLRQDVRGTLSAGGEAAGEFARTIELDAIGRVLTTHDWLMLDSRFQGKGFGRAFLAHQERGYRQKGVSAVFLTAADACGGYVWAREGFRFASDESREMHYEIDEARAARSWWGDHAKAEAKKLLKRGMMTAADIAGIESRLAEGLYGGKTPLTPFEISELGRGKAVAAAGGLRWWGKEILLKTSWEGIKIIGPDRYCFRKRTRIVL
jgi:GNAT superfamily N-acetyltransferase